MLLARGLSMWRGERLLFDALELAVDSGQSLLVRGPNGSGKTTLLRILAGITEPTAGEVLWDGLAGHRGQCAFAGHATGLKQDLSVRRNLAFDAALRGVAPAGPAELAALGVDAFLDQPVRYLSAGQQRRAALARVVTSGARLWLLDEPTANLDVAGSRAFRDLLHAHLAGGGSAVVATHLDLELPDGGTQQLMLREPA